MAENDKEFKKINALAKKKIHDKAKKQKQELDKKASQAKLSF